MDAGDMLRQRLEAEHDPRDEAAFWDHCRAAISEGFCPTPGCARRLEPAVQVPADGAGGSCPVHGVRWTLRRMLTQEWPPRG